MPINRDDKTVRKDRRCDENGDGADERCVLFFTLLILGAPRDARRRSRFDPHAPIGTIL